MAERESSLEGLLAKQGYTAIPLQKSVIGHFEVDGQIENRAVIWLIDTGASKTVVDKGSAAALGLKAEGSPGGGVLGTTETTVTNITVDMAAIGSVILQTLSLFVIDLSHCNNPIEAHGGRRVDGIIGADILMEKQAIIDYGKATLYFK